MFKVILSSSKGDITIYEKPVKLNKQATHTTIAKIAEMLPAPIVLSLGDPPVEYEVRRADFEAALRAFHPDAQVAWTD